MAERYGTDVRTINEHLQNLHQKLTSTQAQLSGIAGQFARRASATSPGPSVTTTKEDKAPDHLFNRLRQP
jgi:hypothetical protein